MANVLEDFLNFPNPQPPAADLQRAKIQAEVSSKYGDATLPQVKDLLSAPVVTPTPNYEMDYQLFEMLGRSRPQAAAPEEMSELSRGVRRGWEQLKALGQAGTGTVADLFGADEFAQARYERYKEIMAEAERLYPATVPTVEEAFTSPGKFVTWAAGVLGEQIPIMASMVVTGGVGGILGRLAARGLISGATAEMAKKAAAKWALHGAVGGAATGAAALETGGMTGEQLETGLPVSPLLNVAGGAAAGALEVISPLTVAGVLGLKYPLAKKLAEKITDATVGKGLLARIGLTGLGVGATEATTELGQEAIATAVRSFVDENYELLGDQTRSRLLNAAAGGALVGTLMGGISGIKSNPKPPTPPAPPPEVPEAEVPSTGQLQLPMEMPPATLPVEAPFELTSPTEEFKPVSSAQQLELPLAEPGQLSLPLDEPPTIKKRLSQGILLFTPEGAKSIDPDELTRREVEITEALTVPENRTPAQQALIREVERERVMRFRRLFGEVQKSPQLQRLIEVRETLREKNTNEEGVVAPAVQAKLDRLTQEIEKRADEEGVKLPKYNTLTERENSRLSYLLEKERTEGLTQREYDALEKLTAKAEGEKPVSRRAVSEEELERDIEEGDLDKPLYSTGKRARGVPREEAQRLLAPVWLRGAEGFVELLETPADVSDKTLRDYLIKNEAATGRPAEGVYNPRLGKAYLFLRNLNPDRVQKVYLHEVSAHLGMRAVLRPEDMQNILRLVERTRKDWIESYLERNPSVKNEPDARLRAAEEYVAKIAEDGSDPTLLQRIVAYVRKALRAVLPNLNFTDDEIRVMLAGVRKELRAPVIRGNLRPELRPAYFNSDPSNTGHTMRIIEGLRKKKKDFVSRTEVESEMNRIKANKSERAIIEDVLNLPYFGQKFRFATFEEELRRRIVPLRREAQDMYRTEGLHRIYRNPEELLSKTFVYIAPFATPHNRHFDIPSGYVGHVRYFAENDTKYLTEVQSDYKQSGKITAESLFEEIKHLVDDPSKVEYLKKLIDSDKALLAQIKKLEEFYHTNISEAPNVNPEDVKAFVDAARQLFIQWVELRKADTSYIPWVEDSSPDTWREFLFDTYDEESLVDSLIKEIKTLEHDLNLYEIYKKSAGEGTKPFVKEAETVNTVFERMIREEHRTAVQNGFKKMRLSSPYTLAVFEGWVEPIPQINADGPGLLPLGEETEWSAELQNELLTAYENMNTKPAGIIPFLENRFKIIAIRHNELTKYVQRNFGARLVKDEYGFTWYEWDVPESAADEPVIAYFSNAAQDAVTLQQESGEPINNRLGESIEEWNHLWRIRLATHFLNPLQLAQRYGIEPIRRYMERIDMWANTKSNIMAPADEVVKVWLNLPKAEAEGLSRALFEAAAESDALERRLSPREEAEILRKHKVEGKALELYGQIRSSFDNILDRLEAGLLYNAARETLEDSEAAKRTIEQWTAARGSESQMAALLESMTLDPKISINLFRRLDTITQQIGQLRSRTYFPYMRFGPWTVTARPMTADGKVDESRQGKFFTFESNKAAEDFFKEEGPRMRKEGFKVTISKMEDEQFAFLGMPPSLLAAIRKDLESAILGGLEGEVATKALKGLEEELKEIQYRYSPGRAFLRHLIRRKGIEGFSLDAMRVYATYMMNAANHIARVEHFLDLDKSLSDLKSYRIDFEDRQADSRGLMMIYNAFLKHRHYIMNPGNDLAKYRALAFMWYLGFNAKSAAVNLTQIPMVTYPYLAARYGDGAAVGALHSAIKDAFSWTRKGTLGSQAEDAMIARGIREGFLDESQATELAGISEGTALARVLPRTTAHRLVNQVAYYGAFLFRQAEKYTRLTAFLAAARLAQQRGANAEEAFQAGKEAVRATLFEYAKWNRPEFMRGKKSVFFLFWTYMQNMAYLAFGGQGAQTAIRIWIMLLMMGGLQGLPFMENLLDILDFGSEKIKRALGMKDPYTDLRTDIRQLLRQVTDTPDIFMHGLSRYWGLGPLHLLELAGVPVPNMDVSGSISLGQVIPGIKELLGPSKSPDEKFTRTIVEMMGPVFAMPYTLWRAANDRDPDSWKRWERTMPSAVKAMSKAARYTVRGEESFRGGGAVAEFEPHNLEHRAEVAAQMFGFTPTRVAQRYEMRAAQEMAKEYWSVRRHMLLDDYAYVSAARDREGVADVRAAIRDFNSSVPYSQLRLTNDSLERSLKQRRIGAKFREEGKTREKVFRPGYRETARAYPEVPQGK